MFAWCIRIKRETIHMHTQIICCKRFKCCQLGRNDRKLWEDMQHIYYLICLDLRWMRKNVVALNVGFPQLFQSKYLCLRIGAPNNIKSFNNRISYANPFIQLLVEHQHKFTSKCIKFLLYFSHYNLIPLIQLLLYTAPAQTHNW